MNGRTIFGLLTMLLGASCAQPSAMMRPAAAAYGVTVPLDAPRAPRLGYSLAGFVERQILSWTRPKRAPVNATDGDLGCLTAAVYYEARSEAEDGQRAVAQVVLNRVNKPSFARSVCGVVHQHVAGRCQFDFICDGSERRRREQRAWAIAMRIARAALDGAVYDRIGPATFYHTAAVSPGWSQRMTRVAVIGSHIFYRSRS
jgi:spore germination cell wall hydrolase CwlJ-like protein